MKISVTNLLLYQKRPSKEENRNKIGNNAPQNYEYPYHITARHNYTCARNRIIQIQQNNTIQYHTKPKRNETEWKERAKEQTQRNEPKRKRSRNEMQRNATR